MSEDFHAFLQAQAADRDTIHQALRYYLSERTNDAPATRLRRELMEAAGDAGQLESALSALAHDPAALEAVGLAVLGWAWEEPGGRDVVERSILAAKEKLPVIEIGILAVVAMYGMYLSATGGIKKREKVTTRLADGSFEEREITEYFSSAGPLSSVAGLFRGAGQGGA